MKIRQKELNNLDVLTQGLRQSEIKDIEISVLNTLYKDNEKQFKNGLNVFDSQGFLNALENLNNYQFKSQEAKDFIKYTKDFNKLFYNDVKIASSIFEPKATSSSSTMATSIQGSAQVKITNFLMDSILRNLSLPFFLRGGTMDQSISKRALKFQIERALNHADGLSDFKKILQSKTKTGDFSNGTRKALEQFTQALEKSEDEFYEQLKRIESKDLNASLQEEKNADIIGGLRQQAGEPKGLKPPTSKDDYNTNAKFSQEHIKQVLEHLQAQDITRKHLSDEEINALLKRFDNIDNLKEHLYTRADAQTRKALFDLIDETLYNPHFKYIKDGKTKYLKKFKDTDKDKDAYFYLLITKDQDKTFITHLKSRDYNYFAKELSTAEQLLQGENLIKIKPKDEALNAKTQEGLKQDVQSQDLEKAWLNTFHLKSLDEDFIPHFSDEVKEALKSQGINEIKLKRGSFEKLLKRQRTAFLPYIKPTLENPDALIKHDEALIFIKDIGKESFFTSISKDVKGEMIIKTNSFKTLQNLTNKFKQNATLLYLNKKAPNILAEAFTGETFPAKLEQSLSRGNNLTHSDNNTLTNKGLKDDETLEKSKKQKPLSQDLDLNKAKTSEIKQVFLKELQPLFNEVLTSKEGKEAHLNLKSLSKMLSDTAINKSLKNGFTREQHLKAVREIKSLFENAHLAHIEKGTKPTDKDLIINRFNSDFENANALITTKEHLDTNKNRIYSVELEITPRFNANETPLNNANNQGQTHLTQATSGEVKEPLAPIDKPDNDTLANQSLKDDETFNTKPETKELLESPGKELEHKFSFVDKLFKDFVNPSLKEKATQALEHSFTDLTKENNITLKDLQAFKKSINKRYLNKDFNKKLTSSLNMTISLVKAHPEYMDIVANPLISRIKIAFHDELIPYLKANDETIAHITGYKPAEIKEFKKVLQNNLKELESLLQTNIHQTPLRELFSQSDRAVELEKSTNAIFDKLFNNEYIKNLQIMYIQNGIISDSQLLKALKEFHTKNKVSPDTQELIKRLEKQIEEDESLKFEALTLTRSKLDNLKNFTMTRESFTRQRKLAESLQGINPIEDFGQNYSEFYHTGKAAIDKILAEARDYEARNATQELTESELKNGSFKAQVAGAFYREDLNALSGNGNIDVVFGDSRFGLKHILEKHPDIIEKIPEIIQKGVIVENAGVKTIILKENNKEYRAGLSKGFNGKGTNEWILTSYKKNP